MPVSLTIIISTIVLLFTTTAYTVIYAASIPAGSNSKTSTFGNPASSTNKQNNILNNNDNKASAADNLEKKELNTIMYENYQQCYASLISDYVGRTTEEIDARKVTIKKYCRAITNAKYQKKLVLLQNLWVDDKSWRSEQSPRC
jgi:hypothetical protein